MKERVILFNEDVNKPQVAIYDTEKKVATFAAHQKQISINLDENRLNELKPTDNIDLNTFLKFIE